MSIVKPYFLGEMHAVALSFTVDNGSPNTVSFTLSAGRYAIPNTSSPISGIADLIVALNAAALGHTFGVSSYGANDDTGYTYRLTATSVPAGGISITGDDDDSDRFLRQIGFNNAITITQLLGYDQADLYPEIAWFPKAALINLDDWRAQAAQVATSPVSGDGTTVGVRHDDGGVRQWRVWRLSGVEAARTSYKKAENTTRTWYTAAGMSAASARAGLDYVNGWWNHCVSGQYRFVGVEDEADATPVAVEYRFGYDADAPVSMDGWRALRAPNVSPFSEQGARRDVEFCAREVS